MTIDLIAELALGTAEIPESEPAVPVVVVVDIEPNLSTDTYDVSLILPSILPPADVVVTSQTTSDVTLTVTRPDGFAGTPGLTVTALCILRNDTLESGWVDVSAFLDAGWTAGTARMRKVGPVVYFQFEVTATASIDGTPKADGVALIDSMDTMWQPDSIAGIGSFLGTCIDEEYQLLEVNFSGVNNLVLSGALTGLEATGNWTDGVSVLSGQVSWVAAS